ncbi:hypothetical protein HDV04_003239 [Boothiomyces sp. JEL0838]|nr:hypothetical protein HDV04_003239 [Boothiomyces sp. JEL0838]
MSKIPGTDMFVINSPKKQQNTPKRPINSFFRYKAHVNKMIVDRYGLLQSSEISKIAAEWWKNESPEVKRHFQGLTEIANIDFKIRQSKVHKRRKENITLNLGYQDDLESHFDFQSFSTGWTPKCNDETFKEYIEKTYNC